MTSSGPSYMVPEGRLTHWVVESPGRGIPGVSPHGATWFSAVSLEWGTDPLAGFQGGCRVAAGPFGSRAEAESARDSLYLAADVIEG